MLNTSCFDVSVVSETPRDVTVETPLISGTQLDVITMVCSLPNTTEGNRRARYIWYRDDGGIITSDGDNTLEYAIDSYCHHKVYCLPWNKAGNGTVGTITLNLTGNSSIILNLTCA